MGRSDSAGWQIETLDKAYDQGLMAGSLGMTAKKCPYASEVASAAWQAGFEDGLLSAPPKRAPQKPKFLNI